MLIATFGAAALLSLLITPLLIHVAVERGLYDEPVGGRHIHRVPVPRIGGISVYVATLLGLSITVYAGAMDALPLAQTRFYLGILLGGGLLFAAGLVDDLRGLSPAAKVVAQLTAALVFYACGFRIDDSILAFGSEAARSWLSLPLTVLWIVAATNAFNLIDGLDGLATGIAMVALSSMAAVAYVLGRTEVLIASLALFGALLGFLRYNFSPARIFLGDSGSLFIGALLAALAIHGMAEEPVGLLGMVPVFALAVPLLDTGLAVGRRWLRGTPFSIGDRRHIHHQLLARGLSHPAAVLLICFAAVGVAAFGLAFAFAPAELTEAMAVSGALLGGVLLIGALGFLRYHEFTEALSELAWTPVRLRRVIRDQIHARDVALVLDVAESLGVLNIILQDNASEFGFLHVEICPESAGTARLLIGGKGAHATRLDYPLLLEGEDSQDPLVLRIWCEADRRRPFGAERVAGVLAPVIRRWLAERGVVRDVASVRCATVSRMKPMQVRP